MMYGKGLGLCILLLLAIGLCTWCINSTDKASDIQLNHEKGVLIDTLTIDQLTKEEVVVPYVKKHTQLPPYYITKRDAQKQGWIAAEGNLCDVLPGKAIGGDVFGNREGNLPKANKRKWYEADLNYNCGRRNAHRLIYSNDGLIYVTYDHYKTFVQR